MSRAVISGDQKLQMLAAFALDTPWDEVKVDLNPFIELTPQKRGERFAAFLRDGCHVASATTLPIVVRASAVFLDAAQLIPFGDEEGDDFLGLRP